MERNLASLQMATTTTCGPGRSQESELRLCLPQGPKNLDQLLLFVHTPKQDFWVETEQVELELAL